MLKILKKKKDWRQERRAEQRMSWMASLTQWTWVWVNSGSWWQTGKPGMLWSMGSQRIGHEWTTELNWWLWELDHKEVRVLKNCHFWTVVLEKTVENPLGSKEVRPVNPKGNQLWISTGRIDAEVEALILWPPDVKSWLTGKDLDVGKDWRQKEKRATED